MNFNSTKKSKTLENFAGLSELTKKDALHGPGVCVSSGISYYVVTYDKATMTKIDSTVLDHQEVSGANLTAESFNAHLKRKPAVKQTVDDTKSLLTSGERSEVGTSTIHQEETDHFQSSGRVGEGSEGVV